MQGRMSAIMANASILMDSHLRLYPGASAITPECVPQRLALRPGRLHQRGQSYSAALLVQPAARRVKTSALSTGTRLIGGGANTDFFIAGADGQLGAKLVQKLLQAGHKVTAGVPDEQQAQAVIDFAQRVELISKKEAGRLQLAGLDLSDQDSIAAALPKRGGRILAVIGEGVAKGQKLDARSATRILLAAQEVGASQFILVTPSGAAGGGGGFLSTLFGGGNAAGGSSNRPSKLEQDIAASGLDFIVVRTGRTDGLEEGFDAGNNIALGAQGSLPPNARIAKSQVAEVVTQILRLADNDVLVEAWATPDIESAETDIEALVSEVLPTAAVAEDNAAEQSAPVNDAAEDEPSFVPPQATNIFGSFGTRKVAARPARQAKEQPPEVGKKSLRFGRQRPEEPAEEEVEEENKPTNALASLFGSRKRVNEEVKPTVEKARRSATQGVKAVGKAAQQAGSASGVRGKVAEDSEPQKKPTFLESIGLGTTKYVDDDDD